MRLENLPAKRQTQTGSGLFGRIERQQRVLHRLVVHSLASIQNLQEGTSLAGVLDTDIDQTPLLGCLVGVAQQVASLTEKVEEKL